MNQSKISFSDGSSLLLEESDRIMSIVSIEDPDNKEAVITSQGKVYELYWHINDGLIPSITAFLQNSCYFSKLDTVSKKVYSSSSVVSIENI